jgi:hypothetical protein
MKFFENFYLILVCNKFNYLFLQIILFVLVLTLDSYNTPENKWGVVYILRVSLILLCLLMVLRFKFLNFPKVFIMFTVTISCFSIFHDEIINLMSQIEVMNDTASIMLLNNSESLLTIALSILVVISLTSEQK